MVDGDCVVCAGVARVAVGPHQGLDDAGRVAPRGGDGGGDRGSFMNFAYGWAFSKPVRKVYYNMTITGLSVAIALFIGTIELVGLVTQKLARSGSVVGWFQNFNLNTAGFVIVAMFLATWVISLAIWRLARIEERWSAGMQQAAARSAAANGDA
jgi:nickel/cobalt transporter (NiCoT) family protein